MIWHILKKDFKLLWGITAGVAALHLGRALACYRMGHFSGNATLVQLLNLLIIAEYLASGFLIVMVVHQDAIPGVRQDWLIRPIRRRDLLAAKMLFTALLVLGPMVAADFFESLLFGFPVAASAGAALDRGVFLLLFTAIAIAAFGSLTTNLTQTIAIAMAVFLAIGAFIVIANAFRGPGRPPFVVDASGLEWITEAERSAVCAVTAALVLGLQYFRRRTRAAYWVFGGGVLLWLLTLMTPWRAAFALQERVAPGSPAAAGIRLGFDPTAGPKRSEVGGASRLPDSRSNRFVESATVALPVRITGLPDDVVLNADHYELRLRRGDGSTIHHDYGENLQIFQEGAGNGSNASYQVLWIPQTLYQRIKEQPLEVELDYSFTLMRLGGSYSLAAFGADERLPQLGWCKSRINAGQTAVQVRCFQPASAVDCGSAFLEDTSTGLRNPARQACQPSYSPYVDSIYDSTGRMGMTLPFRDPAGLAHYPVSGEQLAQARVVVRAYKPAAHFTRQLVIPNVRLGEWNVP
ncbi:MAG: hypothetical protein JO041_12025 [Acidobacteria bacterium]|nr:hypothetical protein [Acidobacteriota bacterium]